MQKKLPLKSYLLYISVALFLTTGVTFSKYITTTVSTDGARAAKFGELVLSETTGNESIYTPGVSITKDPKVSFSKNEVSAYVFLTVSASNWIYTDGNYSYQIGDSIEENLSWSVDANWSYLTGDNEKEVFYILVPAGSALAETAIIKDNSIIVSETIQNSEMEAVSVDEMIFQAYAVQANGFETALAAWESVSAK